MNSGKNEPEKGTVVAKKDSIDRAIQALTIGHLALLISADPRIQHLIHLIFG